MKKNMRSILSIFSSTTPKYNKKFGPKIKRLMAGLFARNSRTENDCVGSQTKVLALGMRTWRLKQQPTIILHSSRPVTDLTRLDVSEAYNQR